MIAKVYVAGPYSQDDMAANIRSAYAAANQLADLGYAPFIPHATHFWDLMFHRPYEFWLELDNAFLPCCDAILRLPGPSHGADKEAELAARLGIPMFSDIPSLVSHFTEQRKEP